MKSLEESVILSMDGSNNELFSYLPYILQDLWEMGSDPDVVIKLIQKHFTKYTDLKVLDLGCGKGAVSIKLSKTLGCVCYGIDAIPEFIAFSQQKATEFNVAHLCTFETGDIREKIKELSGFDIIILGAIGPVCGDYYQTLTSLSGCIGKKGVFIIDDGYIENHSNFVHPMIQNRKSILQQINKAGMYLVDENLPLQENIKDSNDVIFENIKQRCLELINKYPAKKGLFMNYIQKQMDENDVLENKIICSTMLIAPKCSNF